MPARWFIFCLALFLFGCTAVPAPTPTPQPLSAAPTIAVTRPTATNTAVPPTASPTPTTALTVTPTASPTTTSLPRQPTSTPRPRPTSTFTPTPRPPSPPPERQPYVAFALSSLGHLSFVQDGILHIERTPGTGDFIEIGDFVTTGAWSPDGRHVLYSQVKTLDPINTTYEQRLWSAEDGRDISLTELIPGYPESGYRAYLVYWSPDSTKILLQSYLDGRHEEYLRVQDLFLLSVVDLEHLTVSDTGFMGYNGEVVWQTNELYVVRSHCGSPCEIYHAHDYNGRLLFSRRTPGLVDFTRHGNWMVSPGGSVGEPSEGTPYPTPEHSQGSVEAIDLATGAVTLLWEDTTRPGTIALLPGHISPDGQFVSFNFASPEQDLFYGPADLFVIDHTGREILQYPNSLLLAWRPDNHLIVAQHLEDKGQQLVYLGLDGTAQIVQTQPAGSHLYTGWWSPDGRLFAYITWNRDTDIGQLYLWQPGSGEPQLIHEIPQDAPPGRLGWLPNSNGFYFGDGRYIGQTTLWFYRVDTADLTLIASTTAIDN